jgi:uncharacterized repeat protein (TIGR01451 family)
MKRKVVTITKKYGLQIFTMAALLALLAAPCAYAAGTEAGTSISNTASIDYSVSGVSQTQIQSSPATFYVDDKVLLTVTRVDSAPVPVTPGGSDLALTFTVANTGNTTHDFLLSATAEPSTSTQITFGGNTYTDNFDATSPLTYVDNNGQQLSTSYSATVWSNTGAATQTTTVTALAPDHSITVYVVASIPAAQLDSDVAICALTATAANAATALTNGATETVLGHSVTIVFADGAGTDDAAAPTHDGKYSDRSAYQVASSHLAVTKTPTVISDPINGVTNPKAIPNAIVEYIINVSNTGSKQADTVVITDQIPANTTFEGTISAPNSDTNTGTVEYSSDIGVVPPALPTNWSASPPSPLSNTTWVRCTHTKVDPTTGWGRMIFRVTIN